MMRYGKSQNTFDSVRVLESYFQANKNDLTPHETECFHHVIEWAKGDHGTTITQLLTVTRNVGDRLALRVDKPQRHWFIQYTKSRNRPTIVDPIADTRTPFEVSDIPSLWDGASFGFVHESAIQPKTADELTVIAHPEYGTKVVVGSFPNSIKLLVDDAFVTFDAKFTIQLPSTLSPKDIDDWLRDEYDSFTEFFDVIRENKHAGWDSKDNVDQAIQPLY